jgi:hypothetical protein
MVVVLTKAEWNALMRLMTKIDDANKQRQGSAGCSILVHPMAATAYKRRTGREITDWDTHNDHSFEASDYSLELVRLDGMKFAKKGSSKIPDDAAPVLGDILKSVYLGPDGVTELPR